MPRKPKNKIYFSDDTEKAIIEYNNTKNDQLKNTIYVENIQSSFEKLAESILNKFKFSYFDISRQDVKSDVVSILFEKMYMYDNTKGKAFSYFSKIAKNNLILNNNSNYKRFKQNPLISQMPENWSPDISDDIELNYDCDEFINLMLDFWNENLLKIFTKRRDIKIANAVLELFKESQNIENFNKNDLYFIVREKTNSKTLYITKVINEMKIHQTKILNNYLEN